MKTIPISDVLTEFGSKTKPQEPVKDFVKRASKQASSAEEQRVSLPPVQPIDTIQSVADESYERGLQEGKAAGLAELEAKLEEQQRFFEHRQELERCTWANREAEVLTQKLQEGLREIENAVSNTVAHVLEPFLIECMREQAVTTLVETLEALLTKGEGTNLEICGPEDLLQLLREKLVIQGIKAAFTPANTPDLRVKVGQTVIETQLAAWISKFEEVVNE
jgi:flagellar biosynthesis/type III secretory pathway protein FliH